jgi:hypothetical protein
VEATFLRVPRKSSPSNLLGSLAQSLLVTPPNLSGKKVPVIQKFCIVCFPEFLPLLLFQIILTKDGCPLRSSVLPAFFEKSTPFPHIHSVHNTFTIHFNSVPVMSPGQTF